MDNATADGVTLDLTTGVATAGAKYNSFTWRPDGLRLFAAEIGSDAGGGTGKLHYWDVTTAWDISTASYLSFIALFGSSINIKQVQFNANGTKVMASVGSGMYEFSLSTAYGGTATQLDSGGVSLGSLARNSFLFNDNGTDLFYTTSKSLKKYVLSTGFDISTAGSPVTLGTVIEDTFSGGRNGTRLIYVSPTSSVIREYGGSAFDLANFTLVSAFAATDPLFAAYSGNGRKIHVMSDFRGRTLTQFSTGG
jgi:hypothetical protein